MLSSYPFTLSALFPGQQIEFCAPCPQHVLCTQPSSESQRKCSDRQTVKKKTDRRAREIFTKIRRRDEDEDLRCNMQEKKKFTERRKGGEIEREKGG